jgi:hypothetical protein
MAFVLMANIIVAVLAGCSAPPVTEAEDAPVHKGKYPPPTRKLVDKTAEEWGSVAKSQDLEVCRKACVILETLDREGIPYLLEAANYHKKREDHLAVCLSAMVGAFIEPEDLDFVASFLDESYSSSDLQPPMVSVRRSALVVLASAGPKARPYLHRVRRLQENPALKTTADFVIRAIEK